MPTSQERAALELEVQDDVARLDERSADLADVEPVPVNEERVYVASQWKLMWWRFRRHKAALISTVIILLLYLMAAFCEFFAPNDPLRYSITAEFAPPQRIRFVDEEGFQWRPFVFGWHAERDPATLQMVYEVDTSKKYPIYFLVHGFPYKLWGLFQTDLHLFGIEEQDAHFFLMGADRQGRDILSRTLYGARVSMTIGLVGVTLSLILGLLIGGVAGYYGGTIDELVQRVIEFLMSIPSIPLWMGLAAALPPTWSALRVYFAITVLLSLIGWTSLARVVRGRFLSLREEDFVMAAQLAGCSEMRIIFIHMLPSFLSHIIASITLFIPEMILSETALSFIGIGLRPPVISWGVLLQEAQNIQSVVFAPWLFIPGVFVVVAVLAFNFMGDGLRDAADPYMH